MIAATLCYIKNEGRTLMLHRIKKENDYHEGKWNGLGGKMEAGESPEDCVIREVKEESGLDIVDPRMKGIITFPKFDGVNDWLVFLFTADKFSGEMIDSDEGYLEWIDDDKLKDLKLWEGDYIFMEWMTRKDFFSAKFIYKEKRLVDYQVLYH